MPRSKTFDMGNSYSTGCFENANTNDHPENAKNGEFIVKKYNKNGTPDLRYKENRDQFLPKGLNKNGTMDMRKLPNRKHCGLFNEE